MTGKDGKPKYPDITKAKFPKPRPKQVSQAFGGLKGYMLEVALRELKNRGIEREDVESGGYKIYTTFDKKLMKEAQKAVKGVTAGMSKEFHAGLAAVDPRNGQVLAIYGGDNYLNDPWNEPFDSKKQAASAFKPYVLAAWLEAGYSLNSWLPGNQTVPKELPGQAKGGITNGHAVPPAIDAIYATSHSINTAFASMAYRLDEVNNTIGQLSAVKQIVEEAGSTRTGWRRTSRSTSISSPSAAPRDAGRAGGRLLDLRQPRQTRRLPRDQRGQAGQDGRPHGEEGRQAGHLAGCRR